MMKDLLTVGLLTLCMVATVSLAAQQEQGVLLLHEDDTARAKRHFAANCLPENSVCQNDWAVALIIEGKYAGAVDKLTPLLTGEQIPRAAFRNLGLCHYFLGNYDLAEKYYKDGAIHGDRLANVALAYLYIQERRFAEASVLLAVKGESAVEEEWLQLYRGLLSLHLRDYAKAEEQFSSLLKRSSKNFDAYLYRAQARYYRQKNTEAAADLHMADRLIPGNRETGVWHRKLQQNKH